jgi:DNA repair exonuclease SbcCD nuclease subunit
MVKPVTFAYVALLLLTLLLPHLGTVSGLSVSAQPTLLYSFVHLTDTQTLSERFPKTLNSTFLYLEQVKSEYNIKRVIVTGDLVQNWNRIAEWHNFLSALTLTSIEVDCLAGNHDNASGRNFTYYNRYIGADRQFYFKVFNDFLFLYASWPNQANTLNQTTLAYFNSILDSYPSKIPIFVTHYYSDGHSTGYHLSALGQQLLSLNRSPALVLMGHISGAWINTRNLRDKPVYEFNTNYQDANRSYPG